MEHLESTILSFEISFHFAGSRIILFCRVPSLNGPFVKQALGIIGTWYHFFLPLENGAWYHFLCFADAGYFKDNGIMGVRAGMGLDIRIIEPRKTGIKQHRKHCGEHAIEGMNADLSLHTVFCEFHDIPYLVPESTGSFLTYNLCLY
jgi:hypothetical protein